MTPDTDAPHHEETLNNTDVQAEAAQARIRTAPCSPSVEEFLAEENRQLRKAGCKLAEAALHVAREYDGIHRLMLAVSEWAAAVANEGGRGKATRRSGRIKSSFQ